MMLGGAALLGQGQGQLTSGELRFPLRSAGLLPMPTFPRQRTAWYDSGIQDEAAEVWGLQRTLRAVLQSLDFLL